MKTLPMIGHRDGESPAQSLTRELQLDLRVEAVDEDARTIELSFSSTAAYERWWGVEILDHSKKAVRLGRLNGSAAVLVNHKTDDQVGVVEKAWLVGEKGRAVVRFGKSARAEEVYQDVKDGIRKLVSVGYRIHEIILEKSSDTDGNTYRVTDWEPYEISIVSVPADTSIGVDREGQPTGFDPRSLIQEEEEDMLNARRDGGAGGAAPVVAAPAAAAPVAATRAAETVPAAAAAAPAVDMVAIRNAEMDRQNNIRVMGERLDCRDLADQAIMDGRSMDAFIRDYNARMPDSSAIRTAETPAIGMSGNDIQRFSFVRLFAALAHPENTAIRNAAGFEFECSAAALSRGHQAAQGATHRIPVDVLAAGFGRDLNVGTATAGGHTVATELRSDAFIDLLRNQMAMEQLGMTTLTDLNGNIAIPRQTGGATAYWVAESGTTTESQQAFDQVALTPKTVGAFTDMSRQLLLQSSISVEQLVRSDLAAILALELDRAAINGSGSSNQPRGILNTSGIGSVAGGTNGLAPSYDHIVDLESAVANANAAAGNLGYLTNTKVRGKLKKTQRFTGTNGDPVWERDNMLNGYKTAVSNQVPSNLTKGTSTAVCSAIMFGNWADMLMGLWGGLDVLVNPYINSGTGTVRIEVFQSADIACRHPESFAAMVDALTV